MCMYVYVCVCVCVDAIGGYPFATKEVGTLRPHPTTHAIPPCHRRRCHLFVYTCLF